MARKYSFDNFVVKAYSAFLSGDRVSDRDAAFALSIFVAKAAKNPQNLTQAIADIKNPEAISNFIEVIRQQSAQDRESLRQELHGEIQNFMARIDRNTQQTLSGQGDMRAELKDMLGTMHTEIAGMKAINAELKATSRDIVTLTGEISETTKKLVVDVKKAVKNTSTTTAVIVGLGVGLIGGLGSNYFYERHLSREALGEIPPPPSAASSCPPDSPPKQPDNTKTAAQETNVMPLPPPAAVRLELGTYGLRNPSTGQTMLDFLQSGRVVAFPSGAIGSVYLSLSPPLVCKTRDMPPSIPFDHHHSHRKAQRHPIRHSKNKAHLHNSCS